LRLLFTTTKADYFPVQLELMRNYTLPASIEENKELGFNVSESFFLNFFLFLNILFLELYLWKALRRSSAGNNLLDKLLHLL
jgi:hypothetical protein